MGWVRPATAIGVGSLLLVLGGCNGADDDQKDTKPTAKPSATATAVDQDRVAPTDLPTLPKLDDPQGAVKDVTYGECETKEGTRSVEGKVKNSTDDAQDYVITFNWINDTSDVRGRGFTVVKDLGPGESSDWTVTAEVASGATQCVPNVRRGTLG